MANRNTNNRLAVPQFGAWDQNAGGATNYSMVFSKARANRKQNKTDIRPKSLGNDQDLTTAAASRVPQHHHQPNHEDPVMKKKKFLTYVNCCIRPY